MKRIITLFALALLVSSAQAQTFSEWFRQKKIQKQYLIQQIAALQVYMEYAKKGYQIGKDGLDFIGDIKNGDFSLHKDYFNSLLSVNPEIKKYSRVQNAMLLQQKVITIKNKTIRAIKESLLFTERENIYCQRVYERLLQQCEDITDELTLLSTDGSFSLKDDERLQRINALYYDMVDKYEFAVSFSNSALSLIRGRESGLHEINESLLLNGLK